MVRILSDSKSGRLDILIRNNEYLIGIKGQGFGRSKGDKKFTVRDIKRVAFKRGEERKALKLFVDTNKEILISDIKFRYKTCFYPMKLYKYFYEYLMKNKLVDNIPLMEAYSITRARGYTKDKKFCRYMRKRCSKLLENPDSLLHDCDFINNII